VTRTGPRRYVDTGARRPPRRSYRLAYLGRRRYYLAVAAGLAVVAGVLVWISSSLADWGRNLSLNIAADLVGTIIVVFLIGPVIERTELHRESVLERFDHRDFIRQVADARHRVQVLELWMDLLQGGYERPFLGALRSALEQAVEVRFLLLDPDARAAEQRADDLLRQTNVVENIMGNLTRLDEFRRGLPEPLRQHMDVRIYSALPPVQMYRVDDHVIVSFYPVNVTSWNAAQYQTTPQAQLGTFVGTKFDELWDATNTRTLDQFRAVTLETAAGGDRRAYRVRFVHRDAALYVGGQEIAASHLEHGIRDLPVRVIDGNAKGEHEVSGPYRLAPLDVSLPERGSVAELFRRKYGPDGNDVILKVVAPPADPVPDQRTAAAQPG
jgi:hypothetical protein